MEMKMKAHADDRAILGHLTERQRRRLDSLDVAFIDLMSGGAPAKADVEALAEAVVALYDEIAQADVWARKAGLTA